MKERQVKRLNDCRVLATLWFCVHRCWHREITHGVWGLSKKKSVTVVLAPQVPSSILKEILLLAYAHTGSHRISRTAPLSPVIMRVTCKHLMLLILLVTGWHSCAGLPIEVSVYYDVPFAQRNPNPVDVIMDAMKTVAWMFNQPITYGTAGVSIQLVVMEVKGLDLNPANPHADHYLAQYMADFVSRAPSNPNGISLFLTSVRVKTPSDPKKLEQVSGFMYEVAVCGGAAVVSANEPPVVGDRPVPKRQLLAVNIAHFLGKLMDVPVDDCGISCIFPFMTDPCCRSCNCMMAEVGKRGRLKLSWRTKLDLVSAVSSGRLLCTGVGRGSSVATGSRNRVKRVTVTVWTTDA